ncbi:hypothetical protein ACKI1O_34545 [Streptomyces scabiei]
MTHHPATGHRAVIEAALIDWWTTTDPMQPFDAPDVADHVELYLLSSGYEIGPTTRKPHMPSRSNIAFAAFLALICAGGTIAFAHDASWPGALLCAAFTLCLAREIHTDLATRRHAKRHR